MNDTPTTTGTDWLSLVKWFMGSVVVVVLPIFVNGQIQDSASKRQQIIEESKLATQKVIENAKLAAQTEIQRTKVDIARQESIRAFLSANVKLATTGKLGERRRFAQFFQLLAPSDQMRSGFGKYFNALEEEVKQAARDALIKKDELQETVAKRQQEIAAIDEELNKKPSIERRDELQAKRATVATALVEARDQKQKQSRLVTVAEAEQAVLEKIRERSGPGPADTSQAVRPILDELESKSREKRHDARARLAEFLENKATPEVIAAVVDRVPDGSYRYKLGVAVALRDTRRPWSSATMSRSTSILRAARSVGDPTLRSALDSAIENAASGSAWERLALEAITEKNYEKAVEALDEAYRLYPTLHNVKEIRRRIHDDRADLTGEKAEEAWRELYVDLTTTYKWGIPKPLLQKLEELAK